MLALGIVVVAAPFLYFFDATSRIFLPYLIVAFIPVFIAGYRACGKLDMRQILDFAFPDEIWKHASSRLDRRYFVINTIFFTTLLAPYLAGTTFISYTVHGLLTDWIGIVTEPQLGVTLAVIAATIAFTLISDFAIYLAHYLQHKVPFLWEFHKVHHSARVMTPVTVYRMHPIDDSLSFALGALLNGMVLGALHYLLVFEPNIPGVLGLSIGTFLFYVAFYNLRHSHFWLHFPKSVGFLGYIFISPAMHQIHHSEAEKHWDKNLGFMFAFWDGMCKTLYVPKEKEELVLGIGPETEEYNSITALYWLPFVKNGRRIRSWWNGLSRKHTQDDMGADLRTSLTDAGTATGE